MESVITLRLFVISETSALYVAETYCFPFLHGYKFVIRVPMLGEVALETLMLMLLDRLC